MYCIECATELPDNANFCHLCATPQQQAQSTVAVVTPKARVLPPATKAKTSPEEVVFLEQPGVTVTNTRFIVPSKTYAMAGVTSVGFECVPAKRGWPLALCLIGAACIVYDTDIRPIGITVLIIAALWLVIVRNKYVVVLTTASGEVDTLTSNDEQYIEKVVSAIEEAIVYRR
jgi:hypothetical protein